MAMNSVNLFGRLAKDAEFAVTTTGRHMATFVVAVNRRTGQNGEHEADFISCTAWEGTADYLSNYGKKGMQVSVSGRLRVRKYEDKNGNMQWKTNVVATDVTLVFPPRENSTARVEDEYGEVRYETPKQSSGVGAAGRDIDLYSDSTINPDDLPF